MKKLEEFPIDEEILNNFIKFNTTKWNEKKESTDYIFINCSMVRMQIAWVVPKLIYAKGLEEASGAKPVVITWDENPLLTRFFASFGIGHLALNSLCKKNIFSGIAAVFKTIRFLIFDGSGESLKAMKYRGFNIGLQIYEDILRTSNLSTLNSCRNKTALRKIFHILWAIRTLDKQCTKYPIKYAVTDDMAYHEGAFIKLFLSKGARVFASSNVGETEVSLDENEMIKRYPRLAKESLKKEFLEINAEHIAWTEQFLLERFKGNNGREIDRGAFAGKKVLSREEFGNLLGLDKTKKNVVIMAHTFTDAVFNYGTYYFRDYYDWLDKTLQIAETVTNVNWILKPHPTRSAYNESVDSIEAMFARHHKEHMYILADNISGESIKNAADSIITIGGNAGAEYACFGIPSVIVGKPYYYGWGYTIEPESYDRYKETLNNIETIPKLVEKQIDIAKEIFYLHNKPKGAKELDYSDEFANLINSRYKKMQEEMAIQYFKSNDGTMAYNNEVLKCVEEYMNHNDVKNSCYYLKGKTRGIR